jgi:CheY-like chemotaxis protein
MTGIELLRAMRADAKLASVPVVMITAESQRSHVQEAIASGVSDLLVKPFTAQRLGDKIIKALQRSGRQAAAALEHAQAAPQVAAPAETALPASQDGSLTILAVDDIPDNLRLISRVLEDNFRVRLAASGEKALAICTSATPPDLLLLDVMMPGMDGFELALQLRAHPNGEHLPIIFVTAMDDVPSQRRGLSLGAVDFITKPVDPEILKLRVTNFARLIRRQKERQAEYDEMVTNARLREDVDRMLRHDLRGPLAGVAGLAHQLATAAELPPRHVELAQLIERSSLQALDSIALSAELFKIETGRFTPRTAVLALDPLLQQVAALVRASFASKDLLVLCDTSAAPGAHTVGDPLLYNAVFHNLLKNACEAAPPHSTVQLRLAGTQFPIVTVENRGAVPPAVRERLFAKYVTSKAGGTGLGMYSAKLLLEAQGGGIALATSDAQDRTVVTVTLPPAVAS